MKTDNLNDLVSSINAAYDKQEIPNMDEDSENLDEDLDEEEEDLEEDPDNLEELLTKNDEEERTEEDQIIEYLNQLPNHIGLEPDAFYGLKLKLDNGDALTLGEAKDQLQAAKRRKEDLDSMERELREKQMSMDRQAASANASIGAGSKEMQTALGNMQAAQIAFPGLQSALDAAEKAGNTDELARVNADILKLQQFYAQAQSEYQEASTQYQREQQQKYSEYVRDQVSRLRSALPEWNQDTAKTVYGYLQSGYNMSDADINNMLDHRLWILAHKANQWDEHVKKVATAKKKITSKSLKPVPSSRGTVDRKTKQVNQINSLVDKAAKTRSQINKKAALAAIAKSMTNGNI